MPRFRLGFLGAILLVFATLAGPLQAASAGREAAAFGSGEAMLAPASPAAGHAPVSELWDDPDDDLTARRPASRATVPPAPLRLILTGHADARLARQRPRATGPPGRTTPM